MFENIFSFNGRITRTEYGLSLIMYAVAFTIVNAIIAGNSDMEIFGFCYIPMLWFLWAQGAKRCHDMGNSGWMQIIPFYVLWMILQEGSHYSNSYGGNPKSHEFNGTAQSLSKDNGIPQNNAHKPAQPDTPLNRITRLEVQNINYSLLQDIMKNLRRLDFIKKQSYTFLGNTATITIDHKNSSQALLDSFYSLMENIEVLGVEDGFINIKIK